MLFVFTWSGCASEAQEDHSQHQAAAAPDANALPKPSATPAPKVLYYVDPMHPWYKSDKPGKAPDCGMDLTPVYEESAGSADSSSHPMSLKLSNEKQQRIGVQTQEAQVRPLVRDIDLSARVANDPELYLAQQEYLIALRAAGGVSPEINALQNGLIRSARERLAILGMSPDQIGALQRSGKAQNSLLLPMKGGSAWIYGGIYESDLAFVKVGQSVELFLPGGGKIESRVDSIDPRINADTRTAQVRVSAPNAGGESLLRPNMFLKMRIHADLGSGLSIPDSAVIDTGQRKIIFVEKEPGVFERREILSGKRGTGLIEVLSGLSAGEKVVTQGNFLLDSESSLKGAGDSGGAHSH